MYLQMHQTRKKLYALRRVEHRAAMNGNFCLKITANGCGIGIMCLDLRARQDEKTFYNHPGGLEILALRREAEEAIGDDFDIREFHDRVLENGMIPLKQLRSHIEAWIADYERD